MKNKLPYLLYAICLIFVFVSNTIAHRVGVYAIKKENIIEGEGGFGKGRPCKDCDIVVLDQNGQELTKGKTDDQGFFKITISPENAKVAHKVIMDGGPGHRAEWVLEGGNEVSPDAKEVTESKTDNAQKIDLSSSNIETLRMVVREEVRRAIEPIQKDLMRTMDSGPGFREIFGGIGYIVGIAALLLYLRGREKKD